MRIRFKHFVTGSCFDCRAIVKKQQQRQSELEKAEEILNTKVTSRNAVQQEVQAESVIKL